VAEPVTVYNLIEDDGQEALKAEIEKAYADAGTVSARKRAAAEIEATGESDGGGLEVDEPVDLTPPKDLIGIEPSVFRQIEAALNSGKRHIMFYGPPGTGKTTIARWLAGVLNGRNWTLITGSADWSSQEIIGGYQPLGTGSIKFFPGVLLRNFDRPLIIDELNRCDIDKVIGPLFTVLSGQATTLPYRLVADDPASEQFTILPNYKAEPADYEYSPTPHWRLIATINSIDKASLYQMSYALSRRFGWIFVDAPKDTVGFITSYLESFMGRELVQRAEKPPLAQIWDAINDVRMIGPAPIIDALKALEHLAPGSDLMAQPEGDLRVAYLDVFDLFMLPLLDGILRHEAEQIAAKIVSALGLESEAQEVLALKRRILSIAV